MVWDEEFDVVVIGSGGGGLVTALAAREAGGTALVAEKRDLVGGVYLDVGRSRLASE
ncbi:FAD-binding protein [Microbacterium sp. P5_E9]